MYSMLFCGLLHQWQVLTDQTLVLMLLSTHEHPLLGD